MKHVLIVGWCCADNGRARHRLSASRRRCWRLSTSTWRRCRRRRQRRCPRRRRVSSVPRPSSAPRTSSPRRRHGEGRRGWLAVPWASSARPRGADSSPSRPSPLPSRRRLRSTGTGTRPTEQRAAGRHSTRPHTSTRSRRSCMGGWRRRRGARTMGRETGHSRAARRRLLLHSRRRQ